MIKFKTLRYKHLRMASELQKLRDTGSLDDADMSKFILSLVSEWDFVDPDTNKPLELDVDMDELTIEQYGELIKSFNESFEQIGKVPNQSAVL